MEKSYTFTEKELVSKVASSVIIVALHMAMAQISDKSDAAPPEKKPGWVDEAERAMMGLFVGRANKLED